MPNKALHTIEKKTKQLLWSLIGICAGKAPNPPNLPLDFNEIKSVLVIRPDRLGDVLLSTPVYETLKKEFPHLHISALVDNAQAGLLADNPNIDKVFAFDPKQPLNVFRQLRDNHFDLTLTLNKKFSATATFFSLSSGAKIRVGYDHKENAWAHNIRVPVEGPAQHETENNLELLRALGIREIHSQPRLYFSPDETQKVADIMQQFRASSNLPVVLVKSGTRVAKWGWSWEKFKTVIEQLLESAQVWMVNGPGEEAELQAAITSMQKKPQLLPLLSAKELALLMQECDVLLCNHTGIMHLASAVDKPVCVIFKHGEIKRWGPLNSASVVLEERDNDSLSPDTVLNALLKILNTTSNIKVKS
ncbi:MAG: glycosyltransferase family 9 protein [Nitrospinae bacterium]|nr:glycosyltransferase family 9 protein [Nitrospinota bacterium]MBL7019225.1 glycosyltransferase family 9 protein [Nitrospinaceae bacterium]